MKYSLASKRTARCNVVQKEPHFAYWLGSVSRQSCTFPAVAAKNEWKNTTVSKWPDKRSIELYCFLSDADEGRTSPQQSQLLALCHAPVALRRRLTIGVRFHPLPSGIRAIEGQVGKSYLFHFNGANRVKHGRIRWK